MIIEMWHLGQRLFPPVATQLEQVAPAPLLLPVLDPSLQLQYYEAPKLIQSLNLIFATSKSCLCASVCTYILLGLRRRTSSLGPFSVSCTVLDGRESFFTEALLAFNPSEEKNVFFLGAPFSYLWQTRQRRRAFQCCLERETGLRSVLYCRVSSPRLKLDYLKEYS